MPMLLKVFLELYGFYPSNVAVIILFYHALTRDNLQSLRNNFPVCHLAHGNECGVLPEVMATA